ncbi:MAG TPA: PqqD family protein [Gemmatimonadaceae bacterium]|nr:PqqD family protein [Gemmatimonadaceae bacterium]
MLPVANPRVIYRSLPDGAVLFSTVDEVYFGLNTVAARVWELLPPATRSLDELLSILERQYPEVRPEVLRSDVLDLLAELAGYGLVSAHEKRNGEEAA